MSSTIAFFHDHQFILCGEHIYSEGQYKAATWQRYLKHCDHLTVVARQKQVEQLDVTSYNNVTHKGVQFIAVEKSTPLQRYLGLNINSRIREVIKESKVVVVRLPSLLGYHAFWEAKKQRKTVIIELVGCPLDSLLNHGSMKAKLVAFLEFYRTKKAVFASDAVIYVTKSFLQDRYPTNGISTNISNVEIPIVSLLCSYRESIQRIAFIGSLQAKYKGLEDLVRAMLNVREDIELHVLGSGNKHPILKIIDKLELSNRIIFHPPVKGGEPVRDWLSQFDLYVQPSHTEGLPRALIESMSVGLPSIGSNVGGIPELLESKYIFEAKNSGQIAACINRLDLNKESRKSAGKINLKVAEEYMLNHLIKKRELFFKDVIETEVVK